MQKTDSRYGMYLSILKEELLLAMGCTEPVAVAYAAASARSLLADPAALTDCELDVSGNIIKNVKSVIVPNTGGMKGLEAAAAVGIAAGDAAAGLQVISHVTPEGRDGMHRLLSDCRFTVSPAQSPKIFYIEVRLTTPTETARAVIEDFHTNLTCLEHNGQAVPVPASACGEGEEAAQTDRSGMSVEGILDFAASADLDDVRELLERQIRCNMAISEEGLTHPWGGAGGPHHAQGRERGCLHPGFGGCRGRQRRPHERL